MWKGKDMIELMFSNLASSVSTKKEIDEVFKINSTKSYDKIK